MRPRLLSISCLLSLFAVSVIAPAAFADEAKDAAVPDTPPEVSYWNDIRPIFQANCQGCHQPAKPNGQYVMTSFARLVKGGESEETAVIPGQPDESYLIEQITPEDGEALMPQGKPPLAEAQIALIRTWIEQGAQDDTPDNARQRYDVDHPPVYTRPPVITAVAHSPDGQLLAIAGFHEVLLHKADGSGLVARLIGMSERIESLAFSPDGKRLAVTGGLPARTGELQVWNVDSHELELSVPVTYDTLYGASWSPDGSRIAVGGADSIVRAFDSTTGEQTFFNGAHDDWALDTVFSADGKQLVSVGRDMTAKLYVVDTERFVDNITSITPGALKGGISTVARHPEKDEILVGGSDGTPRIYRTNRVTKRVIGDDANLIRQFPEMAGRIFDVAYSPDGKRIVAVSSLNGNGQIFTFAAEFESEMPEDITAIVQKTVQQQNAEEKKRLQEWITSDVKVLTKTDVDVGLFAVSWSPTGDRIVATGADGVIRLLDANTGDIASEFVPVDVSPAEQRDQRHLADRAARQDFAGSKESLPSYGELAGLEVVPPEIHLNGPYAYSQVLVSGKLNTGDAVDVTRLVEMSLSQDIASVSATGMVRAKANGTAELTITLNNQTTKIPVHVAGIGSQQPLSWIRDVNPVITKLGCNAGTCHGAKDGKNGFKLSLRGYDPLFDVRSFTDDHAARRVNLASPDDSLMLLKATGAVPHVGGQLTQPGDTYYEIIRQWIAEGATLNQSDARVTGIDVQPTNPVVQLIGSKQQMRVVATYADGSQRDVSAEAFIESGNTDVAEVNAWGLVTTLRRGEAPMLARYEGAYAATTVTAMGDREGFAWQEPETWNTVDELVAEKWKRMKILPSELCSDAEFVRRVYLDLTGLPPTAEQVKAFLADQRETQTKRYELIDKLIGSEEFVEFWTNKWADLLQVNRKFLGAEGAASFRKWIRDHVANNTPYDEFARQILTASGSNREQPAASYFKILRTPEDLMENTTHLFLAVRFNCNKCHDHPFERWTQDQYYETAAFFVQTGLKADPEGGDKKIGGTAVEGAKPLYEVVFDKSDGEITHQRTGEVTPPEFPFEAEFEKSEETSRREMLAAWITSPDNPYFATSYVNRVWGYLLGAGLIEPLDDIRAGNPPTNPELLGHLTEQFISSGFDVRELMRTICRSRTYQLDVATNRWNEDDEINYSHALARRLPAEVLYDSVHAVTGSVSRIPGVPPGTRAAELPDAGVTLQDGFLANTGRPARESACECERSTDLQLGSVMAFVSGPTVNDAISDPDNEVAKLVAETEDNARLINELFLRVLNRPAEEQEIAASRRMFETLDEEHQKLVAELKAYEEKIAPALAEKEQKRQAAIAKATENVEARQQEIAADVAAKEKQRQEKIAAAQAALTEYDKSLPEKQTAWEQAQASATGWQNLLFQATKSSFNAKLAQEADQAVFVTGPNRKGNYVLNSKLDPQTITGLKLEALSDKRLPGNGPGRPPNGNFVLTELELHVQPVGKPDEKRKLTLTAAKADFSQGNYDIATAVDGKVAPNNNGWAISPETGKDHFATFELSEPLVIEQPSILQIVMKQQYADGKHTLGKFRFAVTADPTPLQFGLPDEIRELLAIADPERNDEQRAKIVEFFKNNDAERKTLIAAVNEAKNPLPEDPELTKLKQALEEVSQPLPIDPQLARLRRAVELSEQQLSKRRLTAAQDITWALINSPAFLFNR